MSLENESQGYKKQIKEYEFFKDISKQGETDSSILSSQSILRQAVDAIPDGLLVIDNKYIVRMINKKSLHMHKIDDSKKVIGKPCFKIFRQKTAPCDNCPARYAFKTHKAPQPIEQVIKQKGEEDIAYQLFVLPLIENGEVTSVVKYQRDLKKEAKKLYEQLIRSEKLATIGILASKISHEINNSLTSIIGIAQMLACGQFAPSEKNAPLDLIIKEGLQVKKLARNLIDLGRPSKSEMCDVLLHEILDKVLSLVSEVLGQLKNHHFEKKYLPDSPVVYADRNQLEQVFLNLVINACHAMQSNPGQKVLTIGTKISSDKKFAIGYIKDNGCGITEDNKAKIFDPFFTTKGEKEGTGLGLSIVKEIINKHHGLIKFKSKLKQGTTFEIYLPLTKTSHQVS